MPLKVFLNNKFTTTHENTVFDELIKRLDGRWGNSDELIILIGNVNCNAHELDALVVKSDSVTVIDFKNYGGKIIFSENAAWTANGIPVRGGSKPNPFIQIRDNKYAVKSYFELNKAKVFLNGNAPQLSHISGLVLFHSKIEFDSTQIPGKTASWLHIADLDSVVQKLHHITSRDITLTNEEIYNFPKQLGVHEYKFNPSAVETFESATENKRERPVYELTDSQKKAIREVEEFLKSDSLNVCILNGAVDTGKTYIIPEIAKKVQEISRHSVFLGSNSRHATELNLETDAPFESIYNHIYLSSSADTSEEQNESDKIKLGFRSSNDPDNTVYILDEGQLFSDNYYESENFIFGSGKLIADFIEYSKLQEGKKKLIILGDDKQIIIGSKDQTIMLPEYIKTQYKLNPVYFEINEVIKNEEIAGIISNALDIRNSLTLKSFNRFNIKPTEKGNIVFVDDHNFIDHYKSCIQIDPFETVILRFSHDRVNEMNERIKREVKGTNDVLNIGDVILFHNSHPVSKTSEGDLAQPLYINNGDTAIITKVNRTDETISQHLKGQDKPAVLSFIDVDVQIRGRMNQIKGVKILKNFLLSNKNELPKEEFIALRANFIKRFNDEHSGLKDEVQKLKAEQNADKNDPIKKEKYLIKKREWESARYNETRSDKYLNSAQVKIGYTLTGHKAEGFKWDNIFVDLEIGKGKYNDDYFRWAYTSVTRAKKKLFVMNNTIIHPFILMEWKEINVSIDSHFKFDLSPIKYDPHRILNEFEANEINSLGIADDKPQLKSLCFAVKEKIYPLTLHNVTSGSYNELYRIKGETGECQLKLFYKGDFKVSNFQIISGLDNQTGLKIKEIISADGTTFVLNKIDFKFYYLFELAEVVTTEAERNDMKIHHIDHVKYLDKYYFEKGNLKAEVFVDYGEDGFVKGIRPQKATSTQFLAEIKSLFEKIKELAVNGKI